MTIAILECILNDIVLNKKYELDIYKFANQFIIRMKAFFKNLFEYSHQYNQELINIFLVHTTSEKSILLFSHMLNAHHIWNSRILNTETERGVWENVEISEMGKIAIDNFEKSLKIIDSIPLEMVIKYTNSKGDQFHNSVQDILFQIINHTTYHRGQIAVEFKIIGINPILSDYIFYKR